MCDRQRALRQVEVERSDARHAAELAANQALLGRATFDPTGSSRQGGLPTFRRLSWLAMHCSRIPWNRTCPWFAVVLFVGSMKALESL
jgi:hypothetical protein